MERFDHYAAAHDLFQTETEGDTEPVKAAKKRKNTSIFCSLVDEKVYGLLKSLASPDAVSDKTYDDLRKLLEDHMSPKATKYSQRYKFHRTIQTKEEPAISFLSRLRTIANDCEFRDTYEDRLMDQFLMGLYDGRVQSKLLQTANLTNPKNCSR